MNEIDAIASRISRWDDDDPQGPVTLEFYPTLRCNLKCLFCDTTLRRRQQQEELPPTRQLALMDEAHALGVQSVFLLGGGEPLLAGELTSALMSRIKRHAMTGILATNGTLFTEQLHRQVLEERWDEIHFSVDAATRAIHDRLRGTPGAHQRVVSTICRLNSEKRLSGTKLPRLALHFVITALNWTHLEDMVELAASLGAYRVDFDALVAYRPEQERLLLDEGQRAQIPALAASAMATAERLGVETTLSSYIDPHNLERPASTGVPASTPANFPASRLTSLWQAPCFKPWHYVVVQADGRTSPCCVLAGMGESVADQPLAHVWRHGGFLESLRACMGRGQLHPRCSECSPNIRGHEQHIRQRLQSLEQPKGHAPWR